MVAYKKSMAKISKDNPNSERWLPMYTLSTAINFLLTEREGRTGKY